MSSPVPRYAKPPPDFSGICRGSGSRSRSWSWRSSLGNWLCRRPTRSRGRWGAEFIGAWGVMTLTYSQAIDFLFPRTTTIKFRLATSRALLAEVGNPHELIPLVHVGGTNGKGSVCTLIAAALRQAGWRVGLYTSPHLVSFRERITVDGEPITEGAVAMWTSRLEQLIRKR